MAPNRQTHLLHYLHKREFHLLKAKTELWPRFMPSYWACVYKDPKFAFAPLELPLPVMSNIRKVRMSESDESLDQRQNFSLSLSTHSVWKPRRVPLISILQTTRLVRRRLERRREMQK